MKLFDENYALYGVDISFFRRLWELEKNNVSFEIRINSTLVHSLSRTDTHQSLFRIKERLIDIGITAHQYPSFRRILSLTKNVVVNILKGNFSIALIGLLCFISGKHPRITKWNKQTNRF